MAIVQKRKGAEHQFRHVSALLAPAGFDTLTTVSVGPDGPVALLACAADQADLREATTVPVDRPSPRRERRHNHESR